MKYRISTIVIEYKYFINWALVGLELGEDKSLATLSIPASLILAMRLWIALITSVISWNFLFIGATSLLTGTYRLVEKAKT